MRRKMYLFYFVFIGAVLWCILFELSTLEGLLGYFSNMFSKFDATVHLHKFLEEAPALRERLFLIDKAMLKLKMRQSSANHPCLFCTVARYQPITFGLVTPVNRSLEEHVLLPILQAWESGFWVEQFVYSKYNKLSPIRMDLPLGFIMQKGGGALTIEIVLLHQREGDYWWHGSLDMDIDSGTKTGYLKLTEERRSQLALNAPGAYDKARFESVTLDGLDLNVPRDVASFLGTGSRFLECDYERADRFHREHGKDTSPRADMFRHRVRKLLATAKAVLDALKVPFWISSGTLLGCYRQCDVIPYSQDVDVGVWIKDYNASLIAAFAARGLALKHKFGRVSDGLELSFAARGVKLDVFFFYEESSHVWNGGHALVYENGRVHSGVKYRYRFPKFTLCWAELLEMKVRVPCDTERYLVANYGRDWLRPVAKWHWYRDPPNAERVGVWTHEEAAEVLQVL